MDIASRLESADVRSALREFASAYKPAMTAEEFLQYLKPKVRIGASLGRSLGSGLGLRSATRETFAFPQSPTTTCVAFMCALLANGITVDTVEQSSSEGTLLVTGTMPSSPLHYGGQISAEISGRQPGSQVSIVIVFPGQLFAWGAGKRLLLNLHSELHRATARLRQCPSMAS